MPNIDWDKLSYEAGYTDGQESMRHYKYDELTGLKMRHDFNREFKDMFDSGKPFHFIFADVNGLKRVNTDGGHEAGDNLIKECVAQLIECNPTGNSDLIYRYSGDEFCIIFPFNRGYHSNDLNCPSDICTLATKFSGDFETYDALFKSANKLLLERKQEHYKLFPNDRRNC